MPSRSSTSEQPLDMPVGSRLLRRVGDLGVGRTEAHLRAQRQLRIAQLVLPGRSSGPDHRVAVPQGLPEAVMDPPHKPAGPAGGHRDDASGHPAQLQCLDCGGDGVQLLRLPVPEEVVGEVQLHPVGCAGRRRCVHGGAALLCAEHGEQEHHLVGS